MKHLNSETCHFQHQEEGLLVCFVFFTTLGSHLALIVNVSKEDIAVFLNLTINKKAVTSSLETFPINTRWDPNVGYHDIFEINNFSVFSRS